MTGVYDTPLSDTTYNPIVSLATLDADALLAHTDNLLDIASFVMRSITLYDIAVINQIIAEHGKTYRAAAVARAYFASRE